MASEPAASEAAAFRAGAGAGLAAEFRKALGVATMDLESGRLRSSP